MIIDLILTILLVCIVSAVLWTYFTAQRLHRLHIRLDAALQSLQAALDRRVAVVAAVSSQLAPQAREVESIRLLHGQLAPREAAERELSAAINRKFAAEMSADDSHTNGLAEHGLSDHHPELIDADVRVELAHRFYNEAVASTRGLRLRPLVKTFRLGGRAPLPDFFQYTSYLSA